MISLTEKYFPFAFDSKLFLFLVAGFIGAPVFGTMTFCGGYYLTAIVQGHEARIFYCGVSINDRLPFSYWMPAIGILTPIIIGLLGCLLLFLNRKTFTDSALQFSQWFMIFLSMFLMRQLDNNSFRLLKYFFSGDFSNHAVDGYLSAHFGFPSSAIDVLMSVIGIIILLTIIFRFIPFTQRLTFCLSGIIGAPLGYYLWLIQFGKYILP